MSNTSVRVELSADNYINVEVSEYRGTPRLDIRHHWVKSSTEDIPTKKGVNVPLEMALDLYDALTSVLIEAGVLDMEVDDET